MAVDRPDRDYVTYRDTKEQWATIKDRAIVSRSLVRYRMRHGWTLERALTTPKLVSRDCSADLYALIVATPGITIDAIRAALPDLSRQMVQRGMRAIIATGAVTRARVIAASGMGPRRLYGHFASPALAQAVRETAAVDVADEQWTPRPYVNPIRARALGLPVAVPLRRAA